MRDVISYQRAMELHPAIRQEVIDTITEIEMTKLPENISIRIVQGLRTIEYQNQLFNQDHDGKDNDGDGRIDEPDEHVTAAKGGQSFHNYGTAIDFCLLINEKISWVVDATWLTVVNVFKSKGYEWGGDWTPKKRDNPHLQKTFKLTWQIMLDRYTKKDFIPGTQYISLNAA